MKNVHKKSRIITVLVYIVSLFVSIYVVVIHHKSESEIKQMEQEYVSILIEESINTKINDILKFADIIKKENITNSGNLYNLNYSLPVIHSISPINFFVIAKNNSEYNFYPKNSKDSFYIQKEELKKTSKDYVTLKGPNLVNDVYTINVVNPVFTNNNTNFWGFIILNIDADYLLDKSILKILENKKNRYKIETIDYISNTKKIIKQSDENKIDSSNTKIFNILNMRWSIIQEKSNEFEKSNLLIKILIAISISIMIALLTFLLIRMQDKRKQLEILSYQDSLTGLSNRRRYDETLEKFHKTQQPYGLLYIDLNDFKMINDTYGHKTGNQLLQIIASKLRNNVRDKDVAYRIGGDEFAIVVYGSKNTECFEIIKNRIEESIEKITVLETITIVPGISIGYARWPEDDKDKSKVERIAEKAMYEEKARKKALKQQ